LGSTPGDTGPAGRRPGIGRDGFRSIIDREPDLSVVAEASDGIETVELARRFRPDVAMVDIRMPVCDGLEATRRLLKLPNPPRVVILTTFDRGDYIYEALRAGASGFLLKDVRAGQLTEAVRIAASGDALLSPSVTRHVIEEYVRRPPRAERRTELAALTGRELEVLTLVAAALSNSEIGERLHVAEATVKTHVNRLLSKLGLRDRVQAVVYAYESNLITAGSRAPRREHS
jgi:DNA-binding NarL/FixJ family response regulator